MKIFIKGRKLSITPAIRQHIEEKIGHLDHYLDNIIDAHVTLRTERTSQIVDVLLNLKNYFIKAEERSPDMYASIDLVRDRLEQQIRKYKTKHWDHHARVNGKVKTQARRKTSKSTEDEMSAVEKELRIVRSKRIALKPLSQQEAMRQMELLGHDFFVFRNDETGEINVLYKRRGGQLGLIEPSS